MRKNLLIVFLSLTFLIPGLSHAARDYSRNQFGGGGPVYLAFKYGEVTLDEDVPESGSDIRNMGVVFGKGFNDVLAMEFEYTDTVSKDDDYQGTGVSAEVETMGVFLVAKSPGQLYVKGRVGYTQSEQQFGSDSSGIYADLEGSKNVYGIAYGFAAGFKFEKRGTLQSALELEYMVYPTREDVEFDFTGVGGSVEEEDLEMDFVTLNLVLSFE